MTDAAPRDWRDCDAPHGHLWVVYRRGDCDLCLEEHLDDAACHMEAETFWTSRAAALAALPSEVVGRPLPAGWWWEVWCEPLDDTDGSCTGAPVDSITYVAADGTLRDILPEPLPDA